VFWLALTVEFNGSSWLQNVRTEYTEAVGRWFGGVCRRLRRAESRLTTWCIQQGASPAAARALFWIATLLLVCAVLYTLFWVGLLLLGVVIVAFVIARTSPTAESTEWGLDDHPADPRDRLFYHPQDRNDDPDPRWQYPKR
jgi:fatty acid desaturase